MNDKSFWARPRVRKNMTLGTTLTVALALLLYFLPRESKFGYEYELNKPWRYAPLIASYDFPIYKSNREILAERDSVIKEFMPFFKTDSRIVKQQTEALRTDFYKGKFKGIPAFYLPHLVEKLQEVYAAGVMGTEDFASMSQSPARGIRVVEGTEARTYPLGEVYSIRSAYEYIMFSDTARFSRELLTRCNVNNYLVPNLTYDSEKTNSARDDLLATVSPASGMVQSGQKIIDRGEIVDAARVKILDSFEKESERRNDPTDDFWILLGGQALFITAMLTLFVVYLNLFRRRYLDSPHSILLLFSLITIFPLLSYLIATDNLFSVYLLPFAIIPMFVRIFMDSRTAFMALVTAVLLTSLPLHGTFEFVLVQIVAGLTAIYSLKELTERSQLLRVVATVTASSLLITLAYELSQGIAPADLDHSHLVHLVISGALLLLVYPLLYLIERLFGFTSSVTLVELTNINNNMLRKMSKVAQGTFNHSMQVANLAAEVANKIGADPQLVRTGALYHDIGKMLNPAFFTENQSGVNPHDSLPEERSAEIIISHVTEGAKLAEKYHLPKMIRDFITTHHGRSKTKYFSIQWENKHPGEEIDERKFTYPGPNPFTREQAILMMCDAVEASSRSLKEITEENLTELVNRIIDGQIKEGFFRECPITFRDIADAKRVLVESLKTIYHTRISYPQPVREEEKAGWKKEDAPRGSLFGTGLHRTWKR